MNRIIILLALALSFTTGNYATASNPADDKSDDVVMSVGPENVPLGEFETIFRKNNTENEVNQEYLDEYADLFIDFKRKVLYAQENQMDTSASFKKELAGYRTQLSRPYLTDQAAEDELIEEAYERMQYELRASHILLNVAENASPADTLKVYNEIKNLRSRILKGEDFATIAKSFSNDPSAKTNGGDLGYFSAFRMVYPFETTAYNTAVGDVSQPFRTQFGYHILKVVDKRPNRGEVKVAHIMIEERDDATPEEIKGNQEKLNQLLESLNNGSSFEDMTKFSDDKSSSVRNGELKPFKSGQINSTKFENTAFSLKKIGDISDPIQTQFGWHILKLIKKTPVPDFNKIKQDLENKVGKDSRSKLVRSKMIDKLLSEYNLSEKNPNLVLFQSNVFFDDSNKYWDIINEINNTKIFLQIKDRSYTFRDFIDFLNRNNKSINKKWNKQFIINYQYKFFLEQSLFQYKKENLEYENQDFANILNEYREGLLLFELMQDKIWEGAKNDSIGLQEFYNTNKQNYVWPDRIVGSVARSTDAKYIKKVRKYWAKNQSNQIIDETLNKEQQNVIFSSGELELEHSALPKGIKFETGISKVIKENANYYVVNVKALKPTTPKTFEEAKGQLVADYQIALESEWIKELRTKFKVDINQDVLAKVNALISN